MRDLCRARCDMKQQELKARQQLNAYVLRHGHHWPSGKSRWTKGHYNWLESLKFHSRPTAGAASASSSHCLNGIWSASARTARTPHPH